jgi:hypothetical protein
MLAYARFNLNSFSFTWATRPLPVPANVHARCRCRRRRRRAAVLARVVLQSLVLAQRAAHHRSRALLRQCRTIADIAPGESIVLSYAESILPRFERKVFLLQTKLFMCRCERCADATEGNTFLARLAMQHVPQRLALSERRSVAVDVQRVRRLSSTTPTRCCRWPRWRCWSAVAMCGSCL